MYEIFPIIAGAIIALIVPRFVGAAQRRIVYIGTGIVVAALATILSGEEWFFIFIDLAFVFGAMAVTNYIVTTALPKRAENRSQR